MNFQELMDTDCGQNNPISQLVQHVTEDRRFQESIGDPSLHGSNQNNLMYPQSFRMHDLIREMGHIEPRQVPMPTPSIPYVDVQNHSLLGATWSPIYQNRFQETYHNMYTFREYENFIKNEYSPNEIQVSSHFESRSQEPDGTLADLQGITVNSLEELENLQQLEKSSTYYQEIEDEPLPEKHSSYSITKSKNIPDFINTKHFKHIMNRFVHDYRKKEWQRKHPNEEYYQITRKHLIQAKEYSYMENNPMKGELKPYKKGKIAYNNNCHSEAILYFEEALRRNEAPPRTWLKLSKAWYMNDKDDKTISALKQYLQLKPNCYEGVRLIFDTYNVNKCKYQACQSVFNWLKNNKSYKHLIPSGFTMDDKETAELDESLLNSVKNIFLKAARENPVKVDADLQVMIGNLYTISRDYDKVADCTRTAIAYSKDALVDFEASELFNMGYLLFCDNKPYEALNTFFEVLAKIDKKVNIYKNIGFVYMYLKNFREAIRYFRKELGLKSSDHELKFQLKGDTLEDEYELCVQLYCEIRFLRNKV